MEEQAGDNEEARGGLDLQKLWELIKENSKKQEEKITERLDRNKDETNESLRPVSYTHLDVYKRQP